MIKKIIFGIFCLALGYCGYTQNRSIDFKAMEWKKVLKMAKVRKQLVFVDCYTSWCGPCKMLVKDVFTQDSVADFFNRNFVCVKMDMEKEGSDMRKTYQVNAYPTLLFIDPETEVIRHVIVGYREADALIEEGRKALDYRNNLSGLEKRYQQGEREPEFIYEYLSALKNGGKKQERDEVMEAYFEVLPDSVVVSPENWKILDSQLDAWSDPLCCALRQLVKHREEFGEFVDIRMVNLRINIVIQNNMGAFVRWKPGGQSAFNWEKYNALVSFLQQINYPEVPVWLAQLYTAAYLGREDYRGMFDSMKDALKFHFMDESEQHYYLMLYLSSFADCKDRKLLEEVTEWCEEWVKVYSEDRLLQMTKTKLEKALTFE